MKTLFTCVVVSATACSLQAASILYDSFDYSPVGDNLSAAGAASGWALRSGTGNQPVIGSGSLSYPGLLTGGGNSVQMNGTSGSGVAGRDFDQTYDIGNSTTLYYSLTFKVETINTADWGGSGNFFTGSFMLGFSDGFNSVGGPIATNAAAPLLIRTGNPDNVGGTGNDFQGYQLGTGVTAVGNVSTRIFDSTRVYNPGDTLFIVASYTFGADAQDDVAKLWVNPIPGTLEELNTPVVIANSIGDVQNNRIRSFYFRNNSVEPAVSLIDDLRIGTTWADVVVPVPEPATGALICIGAFGLVAFRRFRR